MPAPADAGPTGPVGDGARSWRHARTWLVAAVAAGLLDVLTPWFGLGARQELAVHDGLYLLAAALAVWACLRAGRAAAGRPRVGWLLLAGGTASWAMGQAIWTWYEVVRGVEVPFPGVQDVGFLLLYPFAIAGFLLISDVAGRGWLARSGVVLDGVLSALAVAVLVWPFLLNEPFERVASDNELGAYVTVAYPLADIMLLGLIGGTALRGRSAWASAFGIGYGAFLLLFVADLAYATGTFGSGYATGTFAGTCWIMGFLVLAAAARAPLPVARDGDRTAGYARAAIFLMPSAATLVGFASLLLATSGTDHLGWRIGLVMLVLAGFARQAIVGLEQIDLQRKKHQAELSYEALFDNMAEGLAHGRMIYEDGVPVDFEYLQVNQSFSPLTGLGDVVGKRESEVIPGFRVDNADLLALLGRVARGGPSEHVEQEVPGIHRWFSITAYGAGRDQFVAVFDNITTRKTSEQRLRFQARLLESVGQAVMATDLSGLITYWGPGAVALYGWEAAEVIGRPLIEVTPPEMSPAKAAEIFAGLAAGKSWSGEVMLRRKDGSSFTASVRDDPIFDDGRLIGIIGIFQDISAIKQLERGLAESNRLLQETQRLSKLGGWDWDAASGKVRWTPEVYAIHEVPATFDPNDVANDIQFYAEGDRGIIAQAFKECCERGKPYDLELGFTTAKGRKLTVRTMGTAVVMDGKVVRVHGNIMDITERRQAEEGRRVLAERNREVTRLEDLNRMRIDFLNTAAHDLKTPLTPLKLQMATLRLRR